MLPHTEYANTQYAIRHTSYVICNTQYAIRNNTQYAIGNRQYAIRNTQYAIRNTHKSPQHIGATNKMEVQDLLPDTQKIMCVLLTAS